METLDKQLKEINKTLSTPLKNPGGARFAPPDDDDDDGFQNIIGEGDFETVSDNDEFTRSPMPKRRPPVPPQPKHNEPKTDYAPPIINFTPKTWLDSQYTLKQKREFIGMLIDHQQITAIKRLNSTKLPKLTSHFSNWWALALPLHQLRTPLRNTQDEDDNDSYYHPGQKQSSKYDSSDSEGMGLKKKKKEKKPRLRGKGINSAKMDTAYVVQEKPYSQLGTMIIDKSKWKQNMLYIKQYGSESIHSKFPTQKISSRLVLIINQIIKKSQPDIDELDGLSEDEKVLLHKLVQYCKLPFNVYNPNKTKEEAENSRFEILRGEVFAGNDSVVIIKELKLLIVRFMQQGRIPRREGHDLLTDLASIGL
jgi:hypothetical protein